MPHDIFISYSRHNREDVERIKGELEAAAFSCWMDLSDIPPDETNYKRRIIPAIRAARIAFLFFLSVESQSSKNALKEIGFAQNRAKKHVVLVRFNDDEMTDEFFYDYQDADIIDWRKPEQKAKLLRFLEEWRPPASVTDSADNDVPTDAAAASPAPDATSPDAFAPDAQHPATPAQRTRRSATATAGRKDRFRDTTPFLYLGQSLDEPTFLRCGLILSDG